MNFLFWNKTNSWYIKEENVLKHAKKLLYSKKNIMLLVKFNDTKTPKKNDAMKLTIEVFWILNPELIFKLLCINILSINPKVLPNKIIIIEATSNFTFLSNLL